MGRSVGQRHFYRMIFLAVYILLGLKLAAPEYLLVKVANTNPTTTNEARNDTLSDEDSGDDYGFGDECLDQDKWKPDRKEARRRCKGRRQYHVVKVDIFRCCKKMY